MRYRVSRFIDPSLGPKDAGSLLAETLLDTKLDWRNLELQVTGISADILINAFWIAFFETFQNQAPELFPDVTEAVWICDHEFQETMIRESLKETLAGSLLSSRGKNDHTIASR